MKIMDFRKIGIVILVISSILFYSFFSFNSKAIRLQPNSEISFEPLLGYASIGALVILSFYLVFASQKNNKINLENSKVQRAIKDLDGEERNVYMQIVNYDGFIFQNELAEKMGLTKVKATRLLDKLEGKGLVERRRRGMNNIIILRNSS